jgi:predicted enzyme related to lactoylglutathione lyase
MKHPVVHFEIQSQRGEELQGFYSDLFGWTINADNPMNYGVIKTHEEGEVVKGGEKLYRQGGAKPCH